MGPFSCRAQAAEFVCLVHFEIAFEPFDVAVAFEGEDVGGEAVEEEAVVADDDGAAGEVFKGFFECAERFDVEVVGGFVEEEDVAALLQHLGHVDAVAFTTRELADLFLLVGALEAEGADIGAGGDFLAAEGEAFVAAGDFLPDILVGVERVAALIDIAEVDGLADLDGA